MLVRVTYSAQATVDLAMHVLRGSLQAQRSRDAGPDVANAGELTQPGTWLALTMPVTPLASCALIVSALQRLKCRCRTQSTVSC